MARSRWSSASLASASQRAVTAARSSARAARNSSRSRLTSASSATTAAYCARASCQDAATLMRRGLRSMVALPEATWQVDDTGFHDCGVSRLLPEEGKQRLDLPLKLGDLAVAFELLDVLLPFCTQLRNDDRHGVGEELVQLRIIKKLRRVRRGRTHHVAPVMYWQRPSARSPHVAQRVVFNPIA